MDREFSYFRIHRENNNSIPLLTLKSGSPDYLYEESKIEQPQIMEFRFRNPIPRKPIDSDYYSSPNSIVSEKIYNVLHPLGAEGVQFLPCKILGTDNKEYENFWAIHVYNNIKCIDKQKSDCIMDSISLSYVKQLLLDTNFLSNIPLKKRLIFRLEEDFAYQLYHISVVEKIKQLKPVGVRFTNIEEWNEGSYFKK